MIDALPLLLATEGYQISRSVRLRSSASASLSRTFSAPTNAARWTFNRWVKRGTIGARQSLFAAGTSGTSYAHIEFTAADTIQILSENSALQFQLVTTQVFRDPSAWYNLHIVYDSANATSSDRIQLWINGVRVTAFSTATYPSTTPSNLFNTAIAHQIGVLGYGSLAYFDGYQTELNFIDGQALTPSSFGETDTITGVWKPKKYTGTYGTNGFYLNFADNSAATAAAIGKDSSGNGNNWTPNNISLTAGATYDSMIDVPTLWADGGNGRGNYATLNPLSSNASMTITGGNLNVTSSVASQGFNAYSTMAVQTGRWYVEAVVNTGADADMIGVCPSTLLASSGRFDGLAGGVGYYRDGRKFIAGVATTYGASYTTGDIIGIALDMDAQTVAFYKNGVSQGTISSSLTAGVPYYFVTGDASGSTGINQSWNFGQRPFSYTPPTGFKALNTQNLPDSLIKKGNQYFDATTYTGNGGTQSIVNAGAFQPDLVWAKNRATVNDHVLVDAVRGANQRLFSNLTLAEASSTGSVSAFNSNGFSVGADANVNGTGNGIVGWQWKKGATPGFDIVTYTGDGTSPRNISHSLGVAPSMVIVKARSAIASWMVKHRSLSSNNNLFLEATSAQSSPSNGYIQDLNSSSTFGVVNGGGGVANINANGTTYVAYLFAEVAGFSKAFSFTGNGSTDGSFIWCGFRPRFVLLKRTDTTGNWFMYDTARDQYNVAIQELYANLSNAEAAGTTDLDILSNGFKMRAASAGINASGGTYIGMAFAENPTKYALAR